MLSANQHRRIARSCANAVATAIDTLPKLLAQTEAEVAAAIVADLAKACMGTVAPEADPGAELAAVIHRCRKKVDKEHAETAPAGDAAGDSSDSRQLGPAPDSGYPKTFACPEPIDQGSNDSQSADPPTPSRPDVSTLGRCDVKTGAQPIEPSSHQSVDRSADTPTGEHGIWASPSRTGEW